MLDGCCERLRRGVLFVRAELGLEGLEVAFAKVRGGEVGGVVEEDYACCVQCGGGG